ncbi:MAG: methyltransferase domain-containing protein [Clostridia bacterium]|nr:methyltransferase domain-containing protein [Clostridia bacterium]
MNNNMKNEKEIMEQVKANFDIITNIGNQQEHLNKIIENIQLANNSTCLDLGTGNGYVAFTIAKEFPNSTVIGLDIVENVINNDNEIVKEKKLKNISFNIYNGIELPFLDNSIDYIVTRFALHHFPKIEKTISELNRVLKKEGRIFIIDCIPNTEDNEDFINKWMEIIKDGHVRFYTEQEYINMFEKYRINIEKSFYTDVICKRYRNNEYEDLINKTNEKIVNSYVEKITKEEIWLKEKVWNVIWKREEYKDG